MAFLRASPIPAQPRWSRWPPISMVDMVMTPRPSQSQISPRPRPGNVVSHEVSPCFAIDMLRDASNVHQYIIRVSYVYTHTLYIYIYTSHTYIYTQYIIILYNIVYKYTTHYTLHPHAHTTTIFCNFM